MRIDSCRQCGTFLDIKQKCSICAKPIKFVCKNCHAETDEQIHSLCKIANMNYKHPIYEVA